MLCWVQHATRTFCTWTLWLFFEGIHNFFPSYKQFLFLLFLTRRKSFISLFFYWFDNHIHGLKEKTETWTDHKHTICSSIFIYMLFNKKGLEINPINVAFLYYVEGTNCHKKLNGKSFWKVFLCWLFRHYNTIEIHQGNSHEKVKSKKPFQGSFTIIKFRLWF